MQCAFDGCTDSAESMSMSATSYTMSPRAVRVQPDDELRDGCLFPACPP